MHPVLVEAQTRLDVDLANLASAAARTQQTLADARAEVDRYLDEELGGFTTGQGLDIVAFGSMARDEMAPGSDFDYLVVTNEIVPNPSIIQTFRKAARSALTTIAAAEPGASNLFGVVVGAPDMVNQIGLDEDTNKSLSRRILVLQESEWLNKHSRYEALVSSILSRYLYDYAGADEPRVPRFLFNDMVRFWRTIAVDYQAKRWQEIEGQKWGLRYIKVRTSRKWTFAGSIISLFMPVIEQKDTTRAYLMKQFAMPPLARLAQLHQYVNPKGSTADALRDVLAIADQFQGWQENKAWRSAIKGVDNPGAAGLPAEFAAARDRTMDLQEALEELFMSTEPLGPSNVTLQALTRKYLTF